MESRAEDDDVLVRLDTANELKKSLFSKIGEYIDKCKTGKPRYSIFDGNALDPHYSYGNEGRIRAENYKDKISKIKDYDDLISIILSDLNDVLKEHEKSVPKRLFEYFKNMIAKKSHNIYSENINEPKLGNSTELASTIAKAICDHLNLKTYDEKLHQQIIRTLDEKAGSDYIAKDLKRCVIAIEDWETEQKNLKSYSDSYRYT